MSSSNICDHVWFYPISNDPVEPLRQICTKCGANEFRPKDLQLEYDFPDSLIQNVEIDLTNPHRIIINSVVYDVANVTIKIADNKLEY